MNKVEADQIFTEELYRLPGKVLVLIPVPWEAIRPEDVLLLGKILASIKLSLDSVQVLHHSKIDIASLLVHSPSYIISFGSQITPECNPFAIQIVNDITVIQSEMLESLDDSKKKSLWQTLKQAFRL